MTATVVETVQPVLSLKSNPLYNEKTHFIEQTAARISSTAYGDWRDDLLRDGYVVIKGAIPQEKAQAYRKDIFDWIKSLRPGFDENDKSTWTKENLPDSSNISTYAKYAVPHEDFFWRIRNEKGFKDAFAKFWGDDQLLASFDSINVTLPGYKADHLARIQKPWPHVDQSPYRNGLACIQGIAAFSKAGEKDGSLIVYKNSHKYIEQFFKEKLPEEKWTPNDNLQLTLEELKWFEERGVEKLKVHVEPGDLILWDSRTIHYGAAPDDDSDTVRTIAYISYSPASFATEEALERKKKVFEKWSGTTHWAHDNINPRFEKAVLPNGERDPKDIGEPLIKPELTDELLKLAGAKRY